MFLLIAHFCTQVILVFLDVFLQSCRWIHHHLFLCKRILSSYHPFQKWLSNILCMYNIFFFFFFFLIASIKDCCIRYLTRGTAFLIIRMSLYYLIQMLLYTFPPKFCPCTKICLLNLCTHKVSYTMSITHTYIHT